MKRQTFPLYAQVVVAVAIGAVLGVLFRDRPIAFGLGTPQLGELGMLVIRLIKALAIPLLLFAIVDSFCREGLSGRAGARLLIACAVNVVVAFTIGLTLLNTLRPGDRCRQALQASGGAAVTVAPPADGGGPGALAALDSVVPASLVEPFEKNNIVAIVLLAMLTGAALRKVRGEPAARSVEAFVAGALLLLQQMLKWVVQAVPLAVLGLVAQAVGKSGLTAFTQVLPFLGVVMMGLTAHALGWYLAVVWLVGRKSPRAFLSAGADAILTGFSTNSSVAALPLTLRALTERLGVSSAAARLGACVGTNLNNDGATLYEAMAALFVAQALGIELSLGQQIAVMGASVVAGLGVNGIPGGSLVMLPVVLGVVGLPPELIAVAITFLVPIDWFVGRCRTVVNVMSDMTVSVVIDAGRTEPAVEVPLVSS